MPPIIQPKIQTKVVVSTINGGTYEFELGHGSYGALVWGGLALNYSCIDGKDRTFMVRNIIRIVSEQYNATEPPKE